jgi:hypothetical protein
MPGDRIIHNHRFENLQSYSGYLYGLLFDAEDGSSALLRIVN